MEVSFENLLTERDLTWRDFCSEPYEVLVECRSAGILYSTTKGGFFLFNQEDIFHVLMDSSSYPKVVPADLCLDAEIREFFSRWVFYREDISRSPIKKSLLKALNSGEEKSLLSSGSLNNSLDTLYSDLRYAAFSLIIGNFFSLDDDTRRFYFFHAEAIFSILQGGRGVDSRDALSHIKAFEKLYNEPKTFDFDVQFFYSAALNSIIDGYEPLLDVIWNAVKISLNGAWLDAETSYAIALGTVPSFRYVVRHAQVRSTLPSGVEVKGKLFCFLSENAINRSAVFGGPMTLSFGRGPHVCAGRGLVDEVVPATVGRIVDILRDNGVESIELVRAPGLGAEGVVGVKFGRSGTVPMGQRNVAARRSRP